MKSTNIFLIFLFSFLTFNCQSVIDFSKNNVNQYVDEGQWIDDNTFRISTFGQWNRDFYYAYGTNYKLILNGKTVQYPFDLIKFSSTAALISAFSNLKKESLIIMGVKFPKRSIEELTVFYKKVFKNSEFKIKSQKIIKDVYFDVVITYEITSPNFIQKIESMAESKISLEELRKVAKDSLNKNNIKENTNN